ncbi:MAG: hypothetical protein KKE64_02335, partial [Candidatus Omnitrophica bacterium]|nr:hypothetical protein [Candidatus Omnitrophota bacterium]
NVKDLNRVNEQAFVLGSNIDEEVVHKIPFSYTVDNKSNITNPLGLYGHRLEVDLFLVCAKLSTVQTLVHVLNQAGYEVRDLFFTGLATTRAIANRDFNDGINIICDIGSQVTELLIFQNGILRNIEVMSFAGDTITGALSEELNLPLDLAEEIKIGYGVVGENIGISDEKEVLLRKEAFYKPIKQRVICDIITRQARAMAKEIRARVEKQTALVEVKNILVCGRASLQEGFLELLETELSVRVKLARINNPELAGLFNRFEVLAGNKYISYISCLGIICQAILPQEAVFSKTKILEPNPVKKLLSKLEGLYHEYF